MSTMSSALLKAPLKPRDRHFADRFSYGHNSALAKAVTKAGGGRAWFEEQLTPSKVKDPSVKGLQDWYPNLWYPPARLFYRAYHHVDGDGRASWEVMTDFGRWTMMRRILSSHQLHEMMVEFWSNLLHIAVGDDQAWPYRISYDAMIRKHALGRFDDMLVAATTHPCMGLWLDNATSTKDAPNENLGRELLELHSVGVDAGYTQTDVERSAKMLTGYRVDIYNENPNHPGDYDQVWSGYDTSWHYTGRLKIFGFTSANKSSDGRKATEAYIRYLANQPATAKRIATRLAVRFVNDEPSADLVRTIQRAWARSGTDIKATLQALVGHPEFASSVAAKVRNPLEDLLATTRALEIIPRKPRVDAPPVYYDDYANSIFWRASSLGMTPYYWPAPNGHPEVNVPWSSAGRVLNSFDMHRSLAAWGPPDRVQAPSKASWLPDLPARFDTVVDHISTKLLGVAASDRVKKAVSQRAGIGLGHKVTSDDMYDDAVGQVLTALLASPTHMTR